MFTVKKPGTYDFVLAIATVGILVALSGISVFGTIVSWLNSIADPRWTQTMLYVAYLEQMNGYAYPFAVALVLALCLCIPKRFIPRSYLLQSSLILVSISLLTGFAWGFSAGLALALVIAALIQGFVLIMLITRSNRLVFEREGFLAQLGSSLLHLGFVVFAIDLLVVQDIQEHLAVFWFATVLITAGCIFSFYARELSALTKRLIGGKLASSSQEAGAPAEDDEPAIEVETPVQIEPVASDVES